MSLAANILLEGGVVCIPTDTVYGLAASVSFDKAINEVFNIKNRSDKSPIPVLVNSTSQLSRYVDDFPE
ncbi:MAG: Sua5/YciO/YrdC/YwlC family protein, partial [Chloroflexota bacterium]|nr:Sua5/YciO/YrdC/YwlC family protein [Chloroflexota bacterium]